MSMFLISVLAKPIVFKQKPPAGIVYGLAAIICFFLFFMSQYLDYSSQQSYFKDQMQKLTASNWQPPQVAGNVTAVNSTANPSIANYINIPMPQNQNLKGDLIALQNDLNALQNSIGSAKAATQKPINNQITAFLDNYGPTQNSTINLTVVGSAGTKVTAVCHYDTTDSTYIGTIGSNGRAVIPIKIGTATPGYQVDVDVTTGNANTRTSFRVQ
ncbi:hypothetical protein ACJDU8_21010 [Clostridium sp. WILCCON 0269]|uniref:Uncharacterized protein n=1 Tax=Candidatus Clostridium eludens TaxID=3381663 RepID=A0ABW8SPK1_9CLOT